MVKEQPLSLIVKMLDSCAPGYRIVLGNHCRKVFFNGGSCELQRGDTGKRDPDIKMGHVRHMVRKLGINKLCVNGHFPGQFNDPAPAATPA
jgi:hypothetical protein